MANLLDQEVEGQPEQKLNPIVAQYLQSKMDMAGAQQAANQNQLYAGLARAGGRLAHAISGAKGQIDESGYNALEKNAQAPIQAFKAEQEAGLEGVKTKTALQESADKEALSRVDSPETKAIYDSFKRLNVRVPEGMTGAQILSGYGKPAEFALAKFKEEEQRKTEMAKAGAKIPKGYVKRINPETGAEELVPDEQNIKGPQFQAALFGKRMQQAEDAFSDLSKKGFDPTSLGTFAQKSRFYPDVIKDEDVKRLEQAERNFVNAVLRRESGAAISPSEFSSAEMQYFPRPGDSAAVLDQKKQNRELAIAALHAEAGRAWDTFGAKGAAPRGETYSHMLKTKSAFGGDPLTQSAYAGGEQPFDPKIESYAKEHGMTYEGAQALIESRKARMKNGQ